MNKHALFLLAVLISVGGCSRSYDILKVAEGEEGVFLTFRLGAHLYEGEVFRIVGALPPEPHGRLRPVLGKVKVLVVTGDTLAFVRVLEGTVARGASVERAE
jgi:hypothetical protein